MVSVLVVAPVRVHREALLLGLREAEGLEVVGTAATLEEALPWLQDLRPDVAVLDMRLQDEFHLGSPRAQYDLRLVAVGVPEDEALAWIEAGAVGYVSPEASLEDLASAVVRAAHGELVTSPEIATRLLSRLRRLAADDLVDSAVRRRLTQRETEVLRLIADGLPNKLIARRLSIQEQTVKNHVHNILLKLGVHRRAEAAARMRAWRN